MITVATLRGRFNYWDEHPDKPVSDWQYQVANGDTRAGYWEWVAAELRLDGVDLDGAE